MKKAVAALVPFLMMAAGWAHAEGRQRKVRYEEMLPHELSAAIKERPVAYVPYGSLEWHGKHLPYGVDAFKAHALCVRAAEKFGGVVLPATYWNPPGPAMYGSYQGAPAAAMEQVFISVFRSLASLGFKVIVGVAGHDVPEELAPLQKAAQAVTVEGSTYGAATYEFMPGDPWSDHAAAYETSLMMVFKPDLVSMSRIKDEDLSTQEGQAKAGIHGRDPRRHASREAGEREAARLAEGLGKLAEERLRKLEAPRPAQYR